MSRQRRWISSLSLRFELAKDDSCWFRLQLDLRSYCPSTTMNCLSESRMCGYLRLKHCAMKLRYQLGLVTVCECKYHRRVGHLRFLPSTTKCRWSLQRRHNSGRQILNPSSCQFRFELGIVCQPLFRLPIAQNCSSPNTTRSG